MNKKEIQICLQNDSRYSLYLNLDIVEFELRDYHFICCCDQYSLKIVRAHMQKLAAHTDFLQSVPDLMTAKQITTYSFSLL